MIAQIGCKISNASKQSSELSIVRIFMEYTKMENGELGAPILFAFNRKPLNRLWILIISDPFESPADFRDVVVIVDVNNFGYF